MTLDEIRELINVVTETGVAELELQRGEDRVRIRRSVNSQESASGAAVVNEIAVPLPNAARAATTSPSSAEGVGRVSPVAAPTDDPLSDPSMEIVRSPIVGTFYEAPSPGAAQFVQVGDTVRPGQVLCVIESMKLMNEIECEVSGVIVGKLVVNAQAVEYGEALFVVRPV